MDQVNNPNQRRVRIILKPRDHFNPYYQVNHESRVIARKKLTGSAFKLYDYFCSMQNGYKLLLSMSTITSNAGISEKSYHRAFQELIEEKYIVPDGANKGPNNFVFFEQGYNIQ